MSTRQHYIKMSVGILVSVVALGWLIVSMDWREVWTHLVDVNYWVVIPATVLFVFHYTLRALRWRYFLPSNENVPLRKLFDSIMVGTFATYVLPLRAGEFVRPYMLTRQSRHSFSTCFVSVVIERFFDLVVVLLSFAVIIMYLDNIPNFAQKGALLLSVTAGIIFLLMLGGSFAPQKLLKLSTLFTDRLPTRLQAPLHKFITEFLEGAAVLRRGGNLIIIIVLSLLVWGSCFALFQIFLSFFHLAESAWVGVAIGVIIALAVAAPSAPGFLGIYQAGCVAAFRIFGIKDEVAVAYSIITHLYQYLLVVAYGIFVLVRYNVGLSELSRMKAKES